MKNLLRMYCTGSERLIVILFVSVALAGCSGAGAAVKRGDQMIEQGNPYAAANEYLMALQKKPKHKKALTGLSACAQDAYEQKLHMAEAYREQERLESALAEYKELQGFIDRLRRHNTLTFVPIDTEEAIRNVSLGAAEKHYKLAENQLEGGNYQKAIDEYREALAFASNYKDARIKVAEAYFRWGNARLEAGRYRMAAESYAKSAEAINGYKDAQVRAATIYDHLGSHFLSEGQCRNAYNDFERARLLHGRLPGIGGKLDEAKRCATINLAFVEFDNSTGRNLAGMDLGDFIFETIKMSTQAKASQFIRMMDREQLYVLLREQQISTGLLQEGGSLPSTLTGVDFVIFGKINQVFEDRDGLKKTPVRATYRHSYEVPYVDKNGKKRSRTEWSEATALFERYDDAVTLRLSGAIRVVEAKTGAVLINHQISEEASDQISFLGSKYTAQHDLSSRNVSLPDEVERLLAARQELMDVDVLARNMIQSISTKVATQILTSLDVAPNVNDPAEMKLEGIEISESEG